MELLDMGHTHRRPRWSWTDAVIVLVLLFVIMSGASFINPFIKSFLLANGVAGDSLRAWALFFGTFIQASAIIASVFFLAFRKRASAKDLGLIGHDFLKNLKEGIRGGFMLGISIWVMGILLTIIVGPPPPQDIERLLTGIETGRDFILPFITVCVLAPVSEELYFRSMVYPLFRWKFGAWAGMVLSGIVFGAMHMDLYRFLPIAVGGAVLAYLYEKTGTVLTSITAHSVWNALMLFMLYLAERLTG